MSDLLKELSNKEIQMFKMLGLERLLSKLDDPVTLYRLAVENTFCNNLQGPAVDSLRRCYTAIRKCSVYRCTPEWEALIKLEDSENQEILSLINKVKASDNDRF